MNWFYYSIFIFFLIGCVASIFAKGWETGYRAGREDVS